MFSTQKPDDIINIVSTLKKFNENRNFFSFDACFSCFSTIDERLIPIQNNRKHLSFYSNQKCQDLFQEYM